MYEMNRPDILFYVMGKIQFF